jgi:hypothetical protein
MRAVCRMFFLLVLMRPAHLRLSGARGCCSQQVPHADPAQTNVRSVLTCTFLRMPKVYQDLLTLCAWAAILML